MVVEETIIKIREAEAAEEPVVLENTEPLYLDVIQFPL